MPGQSAIVGDVVRRRHRSRRWVVVLAALALLLAVAGWLVWPLVRPLTDTEQRLVGTWRNTTNPAVFTFRDDRTVTARGHPTTTWYVHNGTLRTMDSILVGVVQIMLGRYVDQSVELSFIDDDTILTDGGTHRWQRVTEE